jgi:hypothetical protein
MRKLLLLTAFTFLTPLVLVLTLSLLLYSSSIKNTLLSLGKTSRVAYAALPPSSGSLKVKIIAQDVRVTTIKDFLQKYKSDLLPYAQEIVSAADKYDLDYRLVPAIAMQESGGCKKAPRDSYNCWGFAIYGKRVTNFDNYKQAIDTVTKTLAVEYKAKGLKTPEEIMTKYTPSNNGAWAKAINYFMDQLTVTL